MGNSNSVSIARLIAVPALITLGITILRLVGELKHWPAPWFNNAAGGGFALVGISWLPILFGPYFAWKLLQAGDGPSSTGSAVAYAFLGLLVQFIAMAWAGSMFKHLSYWILVPFLLMLAAAFIPGRGWKKLGNALMAYAFAARIPVLVVMFLALRGNGGQGWGTHYDALNPAFVHASLASKFVNEAFIPQMTLWIGWTVVLGAVFGAGTVALLRLRRPPEEIIAD